MRFRHMRRLRRRPKPPLLLLELDIPLEEIIADLLYPGDRA
jgi:hypothetical protein